MDPILSLVIAALILVSTQRVLRDALHVLMEGVPPAIELAAIGQALAKVPGVAEVHDLHVWALRRVAWHCRRISKSRTCSAGRGY